MINELMWRLTYQCNKKCSYCFNEVFKDRVDHTCVEKYDVSYLKEFVKKFGVQKVYISGGEPAVINGLDHIITEVSAFSEVVLFTNGYLFEKYSLEEIGQMPLKAVNITVDLSDIIRKTPYFLKTMEKFKMLKKLSSKMKVNVQIMIDNQYFDVINSQGFKIMSSIVDRILWQPLTLPKANRLFETTLEGMSFQDAERILNSLKENSQGEMLEHIDNLSEAIRSIGTKKCQMGRKYITINPDMSICICPHMNDVIVSEQELFDIVSNSNDFECDRFSIRCFSLYSHLKRRFK